MKRIFPKGRKILDVLPLQLDAQHVGHIAPFEGLAHVVLHANAVYTNTTPGAAFRGFGVPQAAAATEPSAACWDRR